MFPCTNLSDQRERTNGNRAVARFGWRPCRPVTTAVYSAVRLTAGWWFVLCFAAIGHWQAAAGGEWKAMWTSEAEANRDIAHYFDRRAREKVAQLRGKHGPKEFCEDVETTRKLLAATYLMPKVAWDGRSQLIRESTIDGIAVEVRVLRVLPGVYSTLRIYRPPAAGGGRRPVFVSARTRRSRVAPGLAETGPRVCQAGIRGRGPRSVRPRRADRHARLE